VSLNDDLSRELAERKARRQTAVDEQARLSDELTRLVAAAAVRLQDAADVLRSAEVPMEEARVAHKQRQSWQWPEGRARVQGWVINCGDQPVMLRSDGWLAAVHRCSDPKRTLCACTFGRADSPLPRQALSLAPAIAEAGGTVEETQLELTIRTTQQGAQSDLRFNGWLTEQVADLLEAQSAE
jgi:hypothetical protein